MPLIYSGSSFIPVMYVLPRAGVPDAWSQPNDLMVAVRSGYDGGAVRIDFVGVSAMLTTSWNFQGPLVSRFLTGGGAGLWEHEGAERDEFFDSVIGRGTGDYQGFDGTVGVRAFSWTFDENILLKVAARDAEVRPFECPVVGGDPIASRDRLLRTALDLAPFTSDSKRP